MGEVADPPAMPTCSPAKVRGADLTPLLEPGGGVHIGWFNDGLIEDLVVIEPPADRRDLVALRALADCLTQAIERGEVQWVRGPCAT